MTLGNVISESCLMPSCGVLHLLHMYFSVTPRRSADVNLEAR